MKGRTVLLCLLGATALGVTPFVAGTAAESPRCDRDGTRIGGLLDVRFRAPTGDERVFCSVRCAEDWLRRAGSPAGQVLVRTEPDGRVLPAADAIFVRSLVPASRHSGDLVHAFDAATHADAHVGFFGGVVLGERDRPFRGVRE